MRDIEFEEKGEIGRSREKEESWANYAPCEYIQWEGCRVRDIEFEEKGEIGRSREKEESCASLQNIYFKIRIPTTLLQSTRVAIVIICQSY